jgi:hypothetical protein
MRVTQSNLVYHTTTQPTNHPANQPKIEVMKVMQTMKQRAKAEVTPILTIYEEELIRHTTKRTTTSPGLYDEQQFYHLYHST